MSMSRSELELLIGRRLDGTLTLPQRAALEAALANDAEAARLDRQHRALDEALRSLPRAEAYDEDALARRISRAIGDVHAGDEAFFARVDAAAEADAAELSAHRAVASALASLRTDVPTVDFDALAAQVSASVEELDASHAADDASLDALLRRALPAPVIDERAVPAAVAEALDHRITPAAAATRGASRSLLRRVLRPLSAAAVLLLTATMAFQLARDDATPGGLPVPGDRPEEPVVVSGGNGTSVAPRVAEFELVTPPRIESASAEVQVGQDGRLTLFPSHLRELLDDSPTTRPIDLASPRRQ
jgi:hypothetical protein